jgi:hypothetical protein
VQIALIAREVGHLPLASLGFDGTRLRANNRKSGMRTPEELRRARVEEAGQKPPQRLPLTDPQSRVTPNKEGGFAPNYTPTATVDIDSGVIVGELLADGMMATGENLAAC